MLTRIAFACLRFQVQEAGIGPWWPTAKDTSFSDFVLEQRLLRAYRILSDPRFADPAVSAVSAVAYECGFGDLSYFNRCVRRRLAPRRHSSGIDAAVTYQPKDKPARPATSPSLVPTPTPPSTTTVPKPGRMRSLATTPAMVKLTALASSKPPHPARMANV